MATPTWTLPSNTLLETIQERTTQNIALLVADLEDRSTLETDQFRYQGDSTIVDHYSTNNDFYIRSNGLPQTGWLGAPAGYDTYSPIEKIRTFKIPRARPFDLNNGYPTLDFFGIAIDGVPFRSPNSKRIASIGSELYTENNVIYPVQQDSTLQDDFTDGSGVIDKDRSFYYQTDPRLLYTKTPGQHSPIVGYAFDGNPIYGPYGYSSPLNTASAVRVIETSYRLRDTQRVNGTIPDGSYIEDFVYESGLGDLDEHNGRFCKTPEYPGGVYAYFVTVDPGDTYLARYPYIIGPTYKNIPTVPNGNFEFPGVITLEVISGYLPPGLRIEGHSIVGTPYEVATKTIFRFVVRATNLDGIADRTFYITVEGPDVPVWATPAGSLLVGTSGVTTVSIDRRVKILATTTNSMIYLISSRGFEVGSIVSTNLIPNPFQAGTRVTKINLAQRTVELSKSIVNPIPVDTILTFTYYKGHTNLFVLDNSYVDYQLSAVDSDTIAGQELTYYIPPRGGLLPPGLTLDLSGRITGFTDAIISSELGSDSGYYDTDKFDMKPYDFGERPTTGYETYYYDNQTYDYSDPVRTPKKLNRYYEFVVRASDGIYYVDRKFRIFLVGDDHFRADTTVIHSGTNVYTADITYLRKPIWVTAPYLGRKRANNYVTVYLDVYDPATLQGTIGYILDSSLPLSNSSHIAGLPPGMMLDQISGEIYGAVPYQPAVTRTYEFTVKAIRYDINSSEFAVRRNTIESARIRATVIKLNSVSNIRLGSQVNNVSGIKYIAVGTTVTDINVVNKTVTLSQGLSIAADVGTEFIFTFVLSSSRTFTLDVIGEIESTIRFITDGDLGSIDANFISNLAVEATTTVPNAVLIYSLVGGRLPPGITLISDGTLQGKVNQFANDQYPGLTTFDNNAMMLDGLTTTFDRSYQFTVEARDQFLLSAVTKTFSIYVNTPNSKLYSNIYVKPFMNADKRQQISTFLTDPGVFERSKLYRPSDEAFGVQSDLRMLLYPGIETKSAAEYVAAFGRSSKKRFRIGNVKKATAKTPGTNTVIYEMIYLEIIDNLETDVINGDRTYTYSVPAAISTNNLPQRVSVNQGRRDTIDSDITDNNITKMNADVLPRIMMQDKVLSADFGGQLISDIKKILFGNSTSNIRKNIESIGDTERNYLPLWMRTPQTRSGIEQGFTKAIPLCYCLPGQADHIMLNIKNSDFDFKIIDFTVDRAIIDSVTGEAGDKYIAFAAREVING